MKRWFAAAALGLAACSSSIATPAAIGGTPPPHAVPPAPDYATRAAWLARPGRDSTLNVVPRDSGLSNLQSSAAADVFYVLPTTATGDAALHPNQAYDDPVANGFGVQVGRNQATAFNASGRIYAPFYRAIKNELWGADLSLVQKPLDIAYSDVKRAFDYYLAHDNHGRPIVFVSHSQGDVLLYRLLLDEFDGKPLAKRLVAAYIIGQPLNVHFFDDYRTIRACAHANQTGCIIGWCTFGAGTTEKQVDDWAYEQYLWIPKKHRWGAPLPPFYASDNPLTWDRSGATAPRSANLGSLPTKLLYPAPKSPELRPLIAGVVDAHATSGATYVAPAPIPATEFSVVIEGTPFTTDKPPFVYHYFDFNLFWMNIRTNVRDRLNAYELTRGDRAPLIEGSITAEARVGKPFDYRIATINGAQTYAASGLPAGMNVDRSTGEIFGTPRAKGTRAIVLSASNRAGTTKGELALVVR